MTSCGWLFLTEDWRMLYSSLKDSCWFCLVFGNAKCMFGTWGEKRTGKANTNGFVSWFIWSLFWKERQILVFFVYLCLSFLIIPSFSFTPSFYFLVTNHFLSLFSLQNQTSKINILVTFSAKQRKVTIFLEISISLSLPFSFPSRSPNTP